MSRARPLEIIRVACYHCEVTSKGASGYSAILSSDALYCWRESLKYSFGFIIIRQDLKPIYVLNNITQEFIMAGNVACTLVLAKPSKDTTNHLMRYNYAQIQKLIPG